MITAIIRFNWKKGKSWKSITFLSFFSHHDDWAKDNEADKKKHREHLDRGLLQSAGGVLPKILKLKFPVQHHKDFEEGFSEVIEGVALRSEVDDVEGKGEGGEEDEESENSSD